MNFSFSTFSILYALVGCAIVYFFQHRRRQLAEMKAEDFPELAGEDYEQFILLLKTAYERTLYMGVLFFPMAWAARNEGGSETSQLFFLLLIVCLAISNTVPRYKIMRLLEENNISIEEVRRRGVGL
ncbi:hypothetical protein CSB45_15195 [candidate division KSB3 bacterium]|uniref:Uncharacterized protein n=1 Tax=candidate division KSB3 bacterium TaxID=2044937 RepID=A0A2G6E0H6_9BACT|nr:MAG: hypothetical protein CSB45_15195 [candidate division KSB3 bacterium]